MDSWLKAVIEILCALFAFASGTAYWGIVKYRRFLNERIHDSDFLEGFIRALDRTDPFTRRVEDLKKICRCYYDILTDFDNLLLEVESNHRANRKIQVISISTLMICLVISYFLSAWFTVINIVAFIILYFLPLGGAGERNARAHIHSIALIIYKWNRRDYEECQKHMETHPFKKIYDIVKTLD